MIPSERCNIPSQVRGALKLRRVVEFGKTSKKGEGGNRFLFGIQKHQEKKGRTIG